MANEIAELRELIVEKFARVDERFECVDRRFNEVRADQARVEALSSKHFADLGGRLARVEVVQEEMRSDFRVVGESLRGLDRNVGALERTRGDVPG